MRNSFLIAHNKAGKSAHDNLEMANANEDVLEKIMTDGESWIYGYDAETKQSSQRKLPLEPWTKKARQSRINAK